MNWPVTACTDLYSFVNKDWLDANVVVAGAGAAGSVLLPLTSVFHTPEGKPRATIFSIAHLSDAERMFFVSLLLNETLGWMRAQSGTTSLRAMLYMDEIFGYLPPTANPPSKTPILTLMKQARAYGLGVVLEVILLAFILRSAWSVTAQSAHILLEGAPAGVDLDHVIHDLAHHVDGVTDIHHAHLWSLDGRRSMMTLHARIRETAAGPDVIARIKALADARRA